MAIEQSLKFNWFEIKSNVDDKTIDLRAGTPRIEYRESIFCPYVEVTGYIVDTGNTVDADDGSGGALGLLEAGYCQGTEEVVFQIEDMNGAKINLANEDGLDLRLSRTTSAKQSFQNQTYTITAVSKEAFDNTLVDNRCRSQYSGKISDLVSLILRNNLKSVKWSTAAIDETLNDYHEFGNDRYPFEMILDLQKLAIPNIQTTEGKNALGNTAGYLFWQTSEGFHFRSLDKLFDTTDKKIKVFIENKKAGDDLPTITVSEGKEQKADGKILYSYIHRSIDALGEFESGSRGGKLDVFNPLLEPTEQCYSKELYANDLGNGIIAGRHLWKVNKEYEDKLTSHNFTRAAVGQTVKGNETLEMQVEKTAEPNYEVQNIFQQAHQNYRQKMNISIEIVISADLSLHAGDLVYCEFEELTTKKTVEGSKRRDSGIYMIADLCHYGDGTKAFTGLNLVRDSYGVKTESS